MENHQNVVPITAEKFKQMAYSQIQIPGFKEGDPSLTIEVKATGIMNMVANGKIPNTLMSKVTSLFGADKKIGKDQMPTNAGNISDADKADALSKINESESGLQDMAELLKVFASATMVSPQYEEIKDFMTDAQLMAVFSSMYSEVDDASTFH